MLTQSQRDGLAWSLRVGLLVVGAATLTLAGVVFVPMFQASTVPETEETKASVPAYDYGPWQPVCVQHQGRTKPLQSAAAELMREITGTTKFDGQDPVAVVLEWMLLRGTVPSGTDFFDWEKHPFILCDHQGLRQVIFEHVANPDEAQLHGKRIAPSDLRDSPGFKRLLSEAEKLRELDSEKADRDMTPEQRKAEEVAGRLNKYDSITQKEEIAAKDRMRVLDSPLHFVALDKVKGGAWFSLSEIAGCNAEQRRWQMLMQRRMSQMPQLYISPERQAALKQFQEQLKAGKGQQAVEELAGELRQRNDDRVRVFKDHLIGKEMVRIDDLKGEPFIEEMSQDELEKLRGWVRENFKKGKVEGEEEIPVAGLTAACRKILGESEQDLIDKLKHQVQFAQTHRYHPADPRFRMLHLDYLENRFPKVYEESAAWQEFPQKEATLILTSSDELRAAYKSGDADKFSAASQNFFDTVRTVSEEVDAYPGVSTVGLEMEYNRLQPFRYAWIIMLGSALVFALSLGFNSRPLYLAGYVFYFGSLVFQLIGYYIRISISGRPPVSNMYETVIWVSFMSALFALVLELIYRKKVIGLAGAVASTFGLVLADQLTMALDPKLSPLVPVLRSNYWLTVHVLTIVSSYAGGALAWMTANIALGLIAFGKPRRETIKTLSTFTYRGMQIAVLLLAAGTFLGGWWAAESWGRFWGWDPKETWALISLVCYVIPLHMRYIGWIKDFSLAVAAVVCYAAIMMSWYGVNFVLGAGLHSYGFGGGGQSLVLLAGLVNIEWVLVCCLRYVKTQGLVSDAVAEA